MGSHGVKGDVKGFPGGQVDVYSSEGSSPRVSRVTSGGPKPDRRTDGSTEGEGGEVLADLK